MCSGGGSPTPPQALDQAPSFAASPGESAGASARRMIAQRRGATRGGTLLTGPRGVGGPSTPETGKLPLAATTSLLPEIVKPKAAPVATKPAAIDPSTLR